MKFSSVVLAILLAFTGRVALAQAAADATNKVKVTPTTKLVHKAKPKGRGKAKAKVQARVKAGNSANAESPARAVASPRDEFKRNNPCPADGLSTETCGGYVIEYVYPLACGGVDAPGNMHWQTVAGTQARDKWARSGCGKNMEQSSRP